METAIAYDLETSPNKIYVYANNRVMTADYTIPQPIKNIPAYLRNRADMYDKAAAELRKCADMIEQTELDLKDLKIYD